MKVIPALCALLVAVASSFAAEPSAPLRYWADNWRGWHFYEDPEPEFEHRAPLPSRLALPPSKPVPTRRAELIEFERLQKALEETRHIAVMRPTEANVRRYMELESQVVSRASTFADMAQRIAWASPELDPSLQGRPVNAKALEVFDQFQMAQRSESIGALGRDHVLLFFFRGDCPYCHAFAPTLQAFQARYGIRVVAVSVDGGPMPGFADARRDNGISRTLQVSQVPAVYLAQPFTGVITPIGFGVLSEAQLLERIAIVGTAPSIGAAPLAGQQAVVNRGAP
ncbi:MAG: conjugal transfer protein TraF [Burkholderiales bacterium]|nr:conjugal transfer protein TraF [Burkholderiales bacterium]